MASIIRIKELVDNLHSSLDEISSSRFENEVRELRSELDEIELEIQHYENKNNESGLLSLFKKDKKGVQNLLTKFLDQAKDIESTIKELSNSSKLLEKDHSDFLFAIDKLSDQLENFYQLYGFVFTVVDKNERRIAVSPLGEVFSFSTRIEDIQNLYCLGGTGSGKSKLLESMILQDLIAGRGGAFIDPFGNSFKEISAFILHYNEIRSQIKAFKEKITFLSKNFSSGKLVFKKRNLHNKQKQNLEIIKILKNCDVDELFPPLNAKIIDLSEPANDTSPNPYRINPFEVDDEKKFHEILDVFRNSIERFTGQDSSQTPRLATVIQAVSSILISENKTIDELLEVLKVLIDNAGKITNKSNRLSSKILSKLERHGNPSARLGAFSFKLLLRLSPKEFVDRLESFANRLRLIYNPIFFNIFKTPTTTLNLDLEINDESDRRPFILFHIPSSYSNSGVVASYLLSKIDQIIFKRKENQKKLLFTVYMDEFYSYCDPELIEKFAQVRQWGLSYVAAHQNIEQLQKVDKDAYDFMKSTIFGNTGTQLIMSVKSHDTAQYIVKNCFEVKGEMEKYSFTTTYGQNTVTGYNLSNSIGKTTSKTTGKSTTDTENWSETFQKTVGESISDAIADGSTKTNSTGKATGNTTTSNRSMQTPRFITVQAGQETIGSAEAVNHQSNSSLSDGTSVVNTRTTAKNVVEAKANQKGGAKAKGRSSQEGIGSSFSETYGITQSLGNTNSWGKQTSYYSFDDETRILTQEIQKLKKRELFICLPGLKTYKAVTLDSIVVKLLPEMNHLTGDNFYPSLAEHQKDERSKMCDLLDASKNSSESDEIDKLLEGDKEEKPKTPMF
jgi:hypothetical protein